MDDIHCWYQGVRIEGVETRVSPPPYLTQYWIQYVIDSLSYRIKMLQVGIYANPKIFMACMFGI